MAAEHVQTKREIQAMLAAAGVRPRKRFGQHFLVDGNLMRQLADAAELVPTDAALEVGGGTGGLTDLLLQRAHRVVCVEVDRALHGILEVRFRDAVASGNLRLLLTDALETKHVLAGELSRAVKSVAADRGSVVLVSNLPYAIATPLVMNLLVDYPPVRRFIFTVQAEVGARFTAGPGRKAYGPLGILSQALCRVEVLSRVAASAFWPRPEVDSVMLRLNRLAELPEQLLSERAVGRFASFLRQVFEHRRKTLRQALAYAGGESGRDRVCRAIDCSRRPEILTIHEWLDLFALMHPSAEERM